MGRIHRFCAWCVEGIKSHGEELFVKANYEEGTCESCGDEDVELYDCVFEED